MNLIRFQKCPFCESKDIEYDSNRDEKYCNECGTVLSMPYDYVGGVKIMNPLSYGHGIDCKRHIHLPTLIPKSERGKHGKSQNTTNYKHNIPDRYIIRGVRKKNYTG